MVIQQPIELRDLFQRFVPLSSTTSDVLRLDHELHIFSAIFFPPLMLRVPFGPILQNFLLRLEQEIFHRFSRIFIFPHF